MQTTKKKEDLYKGSFVKDSNVYHIDYGNSFTSDQTLKVVDGKLNVYFYAVEKLCTYKRNNTIHIKRRKCFLRYFVFHLFILPLNLSIILIFTKVIKCNHVFSE